MPLYLKLLNAYLVEAGLDQPRTTRDAFLGGFRYAGSFVRMPEGTRSYVSIAHVKIPACCVLHGRTELVIQDETGRILYVTTWMKDDVCVVDGELRHCGEGGGEPLEECLLRLEYPGIVDLLVAERVNAEHWDLIDLSRMSVDWDSLK